jgi:hypothetical protein
LSFFFQGFLLTLSDLQHLSLLLKLQLCVTGIVTVLLYPALLILKDFALLLDLLAKKNSLVVKTLLLPLLINLFLLRLFDLLAQLLNCLYVINDFLFTRASPLV